MPGALSNSARGCYDEDVRWLKTSQVKHSDGVLAPHIQAPGIEVREHAAQPAGERAHGMDHVGASRQDG